MSHLPSRQRHDERHLQADQERRLAAARYLWIQSRRSGSEVGLSEGFHLADPGNIEEATEAYHVAIMALIDKGMSDVRAKVHEAAIILGLDASASNRRASSNKRDLHGSNR